MALETVFVTQAFVDPSGRVTLLAVPGPIDIEPRIDDGLDRKPRFLDRLRQALRGIGRVVGALEIES